MDKPWFKFIASNWLSGSVQLLSDAEKGTYIDLIAMIWKEGGQLEFNKLLSRKLRIDHATACDRINSYCELNILQCKDTVLSIKFIDDQLKDIKNRSEKARENAEKRWSKKETPMQPHANKKREEEKRRDKSIEERKEEFKKLTQSEWSRLGGNNYMPESEAIEFTKYWVEHGAQDKKMRFEKEKSFGVGRRLGTWKKFYDQKNAQYSEGRANA
jgi:hypothetical protein